jgi:hypothetical protein
MAGRDFALSAFRGSRQLISRMKEALTLDRGLPVEDLSQSASLGEYLLL